jgi:DNA-directed RNA polymerase specialized sigma subunit
MEKNVIWAGGKYSVSPFHDFLKGFPLTPLQIDSFKNKLSQVIEQLPHEEKVVLSLYHCEEMTFTEIGNILQRSEQDIFQLYLNAISNIRSKIHPNVSKG